MREALAQDPAADPIALNPTTPVVLPATTAVQQAVKAATVDSVAKKQSFIWASIILAVVLFFSVMALLFMDSGAEKDTILYAKFLRVGDVG